MEETPIVVQNPVTDDGQGTPPVEESAEKSEEAVKLEAEKARLEAEIEGLEGTKASLLDDVVRTRKEKKEVAQPTPQVDVEKLKAEVEASVVAKVSGTINSLKEELIKAKDSEIKAKKAVVDSINARMASASGSSGPSSPESQVENQVELSNEEKEIANLVGLKDPRYLRDTELMK